MNKYETKNLIRVNKSVARKLYKLGFDVGLCPCKAYPESPWGLMSTCNRYSDCIDESDNNYFDKLVDMFIWYNCNNELGQYPAYYVDKNAYLHFSFKDGSNPYYYRGSAVDCLSEINRWSKNWIIEGGKSHCFELKRKHPIV